MLFCPSVLQINFCHFSGAKEIFNVRVRTSKSSIGAFGCEFSLSGGGIEQTTNLIRRDIEIIAS